MHCRVGGDLVTVTWVRPSAQLLEAETMRHIFMNNYHLCNEISERVVQHFVHCIETHGRHVEYLRFLQTIVKADGKYVKKCQDMVMTEVGSQSVSCQLRIGSAHMHTILSEQGERLPTCAWEVVAFIMTS